MVRLTAAVVAVLTALVLVAAGAGAQQPGEFPGAGPHDGTVHVNWTPNPAAARYEIVASPLYASWARQVTYVDAPSSATTLHLVGGLEVGEYSIAVFSLDSQGAEIGQARGWTGGFVSNVGMKARVPSRVTQRSRTTTVSFSISFDQPLASARVLTVTPESGGTFPGVVNAVAGVDYNPASSQVNLRRGVRTVHLKVKVLADATPKLHEQKLMWVKIDAGDGVGSLAVRVWIRS